MKYEKWSASQGRGDMPGIARREDAPFVKTMDDLVALSGAVEAFKRQYEELQKHMDFIGKAIESKVKSSCVEAQRLCEMMNSKGLRKYIIANISDRAKLMEEIPAALRVAKEPGKLVLECVGKFYLQGRKAFVMDSPMFSARNVSLVILESFLLMPRHEASSPSKNQEAEAAAVAWKKRLTNEGGLAAADQLDATGLLLLIASFGIPSSFHHTDLMDLIQLSASPHILPALQRSPYLLPMISVIVESCTNRGMHLQALELVFTFGMEDKFPPCSILTAFLEFSMESFESAKRKANSPIAFKEAIETHLAALASVLRCLETHNLDPEKLVQIKQLMVKLEKDNLQLDKQMEEKAIEEALLSNRLYNQQMKRPRLSSSSYSPIYRDRSFPTHSNGDRDDISALVTSYLGPSSSFPHRSTHRRSPEYVVPSGRLGRNVSAYEHLPQSLYSPLPRRHSPSPVHGHRLSQQYSPIHGEEQILFSRQRVYRHSSSKERYLGFPHHRSPQHNTSTDHSGGL